MREIKCRAWDTISERYYYNVQATHDSDIGDSFQNILDNDELIVEQSIGINDKNGVDIHENDIVKAVEEDVDFEDEYYQIVYNETGDYPAFDLKGWTGEVNGISELLLTRGIEVVGNVHENADLLEEL